MRLLGHCIKILHNPPDPTFIKWQIYPILSPQRFGAINKFFLECYENILDLMIFLCYIMKILFKNIALRYGQKNMG